VIVLMNGFLFYWMSWLLWVIVTFFLNKSKLRTILACWLLIIIFTSNTYVSIDNYTLLLGYVIFFLGVIFIHTLLPRPFYHLFVSFTIMIGYTSILLWKDGSSLSLFIPELIFIPIFSSFLILLLTTKLYSRVITGVLGMSTAELLYGFIITEYQVNITIGNLAFFDILFTTITLLFFIDRIQYGLLKSYARLATYKQTVTWQNE